MTCITATLISLNWGIYVWAIGSGRALDAALGYYINPLFNIALGAILLREALTRAQKFAVAMAAGAVLVLAIEAGSLPWVAIGLTLTLGGYVYLKKLSPVGPNQGFLLEVMILTIPGLAYIFYLTATGSSHFAGTSYDTWLLLGSGLVTAVPMILYANGAKLVRLSTMGILQYITPTMIMLEAVLLFGEEFGQAQMIAFPLIWGSLLVYSVPMIRQMRNRPV